MTDFSKKGAYQKVEKKERSTIAGILAAFTCVICLAFFVVSPMKELRMADRMLNVDPISATISEFRNDEYDWYARAQFALKDKFYTVSLIDYPSSLVVGQQVMVNYDPINPEKATINASDFADDVKQSIMWGLIASVIAPLIVLVFMTRYVQTGEGAIDNYEGYSNANW